MTTNTAPAETMTPCPSWCHQHHPAEQPGDLGTHYTTEVDTPFGKLVGGDYFHHDGTVYGRLLSIGDNEFTPAQARATAAELVRLAKLLEDTDPVNVAYAQAHPDNECREASGDRHCNRPLGHDGEHMPPGERTTDEWYLERNGAWGRPEHEAAVARARAEIAAELADSA